MLLLLLLLHKKSSVYPSRSVSVEQNCAPSFSFFHHSVPLSYRCLAERVGEVLTLWVMWCFLEFLTGKFNVL